jgi:hypothetical protein
MTGLGGKTALLAGVAMPMDGGGAARRPER